MHNFLDQLELWISLGLFFIYLVGLWNAIHAVMNVRSSQGAIAWGMVLIFFPWVALPFYWVLGRWKFRGYMEAFQEAYRQNEFQKQELYQELQTYESPLPPPWTYLEQLGRNLTGFGFTTHNSARLLLNGEETYSAMLRAIAQATDYILLQTYILRDDQISQQFQQALIELSQQGVRVFVLYDAIGSSRLSNGFILRLKNAGVNISAFRSTKGWRHRFQVNFRNHRKILIVDGQTGFEGGLNIGDEYLGKNDRIGLWRDTHIQVWGPSVQCLQLTFLKDWYWAQNTFPTVTWQVRPPTTQAHQLAFVFSPGPAEPIDDCTYFFCQLIHLARQRVWIASPYFVPDTPLLTALKTAALRGVEVRILLPARPDQFLVYLSSFSYYQEMLQAGVSLYRYQPGFMHQKVVLVDEEIAAVGTINLDNRSFRLNFEVTVMMYDIQFAQEVEAMLIQDFQKSVEVSFGDYQSRWLGFKVMVQVSRLMAPLQ